MASHDIIRIAREITDIQKGTDLSLAVAAKESNIQKVKALILGPPGTPYEYGFFEFTVKFGSGYPSKPPKVEATTTNHGQVRFNPNIYADGKVCLSILGTWRGEEGEQWSSAQGLESVLLSIQSLMSSNPYENEPGYENSRGDRDKDTREEYCAKIKHETLRVAVIQKLEDMFDITYDKPQSSTPARASQGSDDSDSGDKLPGESKPSVFEPFNDLLKRRFLWYYDMYVNSIEEGARKRSPDSRFKMMRFETPENCMNGMFQYAELKKRLDRVKTKLDHETNSWAIVGQRAKKGDLHNAFALQNQFNNFHLYQKEKNIHNIVVTLLDENPFVWIITYFGISGSYLDGGMFRIRVNVSPRFPEEQPRVQFETKIYHHRVSKDGVLCYFPEKTDEVKYHIEAIVAAIEEISPPYDPRAIVHPEATRLLWGSEGDKKMYHRLQRRSAQASMDEV